MLLEHESISKQHCVVQHRQIVKQTMVGKYETCIKPYIIDLDSSNGIFINGERLDSGRYYELREKDLISFGASTRDYIVLPYDV